MDNVGVDDRFKAAEQCIHAHNNSNGNDRDIHRPADEDVHCDRCGIKEYSKHERHEYSPYQRNENTHKLIVPPSQKFRDRVYFRPPVVRNKDERADDHRRNASDPVEICNRDAVHVGRSGKPDKLKRADIGYHHRHADRPPREFPSAEKIILVAFIGPPKPVSEDHYSKQISDDDEKIYA